MENIIYNELRYRDYSVDVGIVEYNYKNAEPFRYHIGKLNQGLLGDLRWNLKRSALMTIRCFMTC